VKQKDLIKKIQEFGYEFVRHGGNHDVYSNGMRFEMIPRHKEIDEILAKTIIKRCGGN
jgi:mRNA interferase HicA